MHWPSFIKGSLAFLAAALSPMLVGALTAWLFEDLAFFFGALMVVAYAAVAAYFTAWRVRDSLGPPWRLVSFMLVLLGGGWMGIVTISWIAPFSK